MSNHDAFVQSATEHALATLRKGGQVAPYAVFEHAGGTFLFETPWSFSQTGKMMFSDTCRMIALVLKATRFTMVSEGWANTQLKPSDYDGSLNGKPGTVEVLMIPTETRDGARMTIKVIERNKGEVTLRDYDLPGSKDSDGAFGGTMSNILPPIQILLDPRAHQMAATTLKTLGIDVRPQKAN